MRKRGLSQINAEIIICVNLRFKIDTGYSKTKLVCEKMEWNTETQRHRALFFERTEFTE